MQSAHHNFASFFLLLLSEMCNVTTIANIYRSTWSMALLCSIFICLFAVLMKELSQKKIVFYQTYHHYHTRHLGCISCSTTLSSRHCLVRSEMEATNPGKSGHSRKSFNCSAMHCIRKRIFYQTENYACLDFCLLPAPRCGPPLAVVVVPTWASCQTVLKYVCVCAAYTPKNEATNNKKGEQEEREEITCDEMTTCIAISSRTVLEPFL